MCTTVQSGCRIISNCTFFGFFSTARGVKGENTESSQRGAMFSLGQCCKSVMPSKYLLSRVTIFESENEKLYAAGYAFDEYIYHSTVHVDNML